MKHHKMIEKHHNNYKVWYHLTALKIWWERMDLVACFSSFDRLKWCHQFCECVCPLSTLWEGWRLLLHDSAHLWLLPELWLRELDLSTAAAASGGKNTCLQLLAQQRQTTLSKYRSRLGNITSHYTQQVSHISYCRKKGTCGGGQRETWYTSWSVSWMPKQLFIPTQKKKRIRRIVT